MLVEHVFKKAPNEKNFKNRSISFQKEQVDNISKDDLITIYVSFEGAKTKISISGADFCNKLQKKDTTNFLGEKETYFVFKY
jgi:hypothetical protein